MLELNLSPDPILKHHFQLSEFRRGQWEIISSLREKKDVLAVLPTGGGKSLCYQYPSVADKGLVIVISPLIALMKDQVMNLKQKGISCGALYSGQSYHEKLAVFDNLKKSENFLLYLSPERVQKEGFQKWIMNRKILLFAIDEAHCISQWGHDFREEYAQLDCLKKLRPDVPVLALTASATPTVLRDISLKLKMKNPEKRVHGFYRSNLFYQVEFCEDEDQKLIYIRQGINKFKNGRIIIYCGTRKTTEELAYKIKKWTNSVHFYHAGLTNEERTQIQEAYATHKIRILVATNAFGMGVDQPDVRLVMHYNLPANIDALYQEMGRAGRDGLPSSCLLLHSKKDKGLQSFFIQNNESPQDIKNARWRNLDLLLEYCQSSECRHAEILTYYKDQQRIQKCGHCDTCNPQSERKIQYFGGVSQNKNNLLTKSNHQTTSIFGVNNLNVEQTELFFELKAWRKNKSLELDTPAFVIFSDSTLRLIAFYCPQDLNHLSQIKGIGDKKMISFGAEILHITKTFSKP